MVEKAESIKINEHCEHIFNVAMAIQIIFNSLLSYHL